MILVTVGRRPNTNGLALEKAGVERNPQGFITVNQSLQTNVAHIYAIGDVAGQPMLAHKAGKEAEVAAEHIAGEGAVYDAKVVPAVVFTDPEIATVGMSEAEAKKAGYDVLIGKFPFAANARSLISSGGEGFVKLIADKGSHTLLGALIVGFEAGTMISEAAAMIEMGASLDDLAMIIHPHPTAPEALPEAAMAALGHAIHIPNTAHTK
jgi:dihydrolipoamide dehydrogenase